MKYFFLIFLSFLSVASVAQKQANMWYFGYQVGIDFNTNPPTALNTSNLNNAEGCSSISDTNGQLLFYTDGNTIWDKTQSIMANGTGLFADYSASQNSIIIPKPLSNHLYYVFTQGANTSTIPGLYYSIVDMNLAAGNGSVTLKNVSVFTSGTEKLTATKHANDTDVWILTHDWNNNTFRANLLSSNGLNHSPVLSAIGAVHSQSTSWAGYMKLSPNGKKLAVMFTSGGTGTELFDFEPQTGVVSNLISLSTYTGMYGCEFSPDSKKLYTSGLYNGNLHQFDLCQNNATLIINSHQLINNGNYINALQLGTDDKIYVAKGGQSIGIINNPNEVGAACNYNPSGLIVNSGTVDAGLPNFLSSYFNKQVKLSILSTRGSSLCLGEKSTLTAMGANTYT